MNNYRGIVQLSGNDVLLNAGGVIVKLEGKIDDLQAKSGSMVTVSGEQQGDVIRNASLLLNEESSTGPSTQVRMFDKVIDVIKLNNDRLSGPGVLGVRPGFSERGEGTSFDPVIIVVIRPNEIIADLPSSIDGIRVERRIATALELVEGLLPLAAWEGLSMEAAPAIQYVPPDPTVVELKEMRVRNITCHIGPDSGWTSLKPFLEGTTSSLTVAMYEFYASHIVDTMVSLGEESDAGLDMILHVSSNDNEIKELLSETWKTRLHFAKASVSGPRRVFNNSYHTKVAVRDSNSFWLSSGNWSPLSQPVIAAGTENFAYKNGNREWHVIIEDEPLAVMYEKFIRYDMEKAMEAGEPEAAPVMPDLLIPQDFFAAEAAVVQPRLFKAKTFAATGAPVRVKPLMSPDNYAEEVARLINGAAHSLYLQFSYIRQPSTEKFDDIITAIAGKMADGLDVRVLVSSNQKAEHSDLLIGQRGWKRSMFRKQTSKMHNKGILIDGKIAVVGSNNWSSDGTQYNRDTSLVFFSRPITKYYSEVFLFDWNNLSRPITSTEEITPVLAPETGPTPLGMIRVPWQAWFDE